MTSRSHRAWEKMPATYASDSMISDDESFGSLNDEERFQEITSPDHPPEDFHMDGDDNATPTPLPSPPAESSRVHGVHTTPQPASFSIDASGWHTPSTPHFSKLGSTDLPLSHLGSPAPITGSGNGYLFETDGQPLSSSSSHPHKRMVMSSPNCQQLDHANGLAKASFARARKLNLQRRLTENTNQALSIQLQNLQAANSIGHQVLDDLQAEVDALRQTNDTYRNAFVNFSKEKEELEREKKEQEELLGQYKDGYKRYKSDFERVTSGFDNFVNESTKEKKIMEEANANSIAALKQQIQQKNNEIATLRNTSAQSGHAHGPMAPVNILRSKRRRDVLSSPPAPIGIIPYRVPESPAAPSPEGQPLSIGDSRASSIEAPLLNTPLPPPSTSVPPVPSLPLNEATMTLVLTQVMKALGVVHATVPEKKPLKRVSKREVKSRSEALGLSVKDLNGWKDSIRTFWKSKYRVTGYNGFITYQPVDPTTAKRCREGNEHPGNSCQLDFSQGFENSVWNQVILDRYAQEILQEAEADKWEFQGVDEDFVVTLLRNHLRRSREKWWEAQPRFLETLTPPRYETLEEVSKRLEYNDTGRLAAAASRARRQRKLERRQDIVTQVIVLKTDRAHPDLETWEYFKKLLEHLSVDGMSSEEDGISEIGGVPQSVFRVKICPWRAPEIKNYLKLIDDFPKTSTLQIYNSKSIPRIQTNIASNAVKKGLPERMYDSDWLKRARVTRRTWVEKELRVSKESFSLLVVAAEAINASVIPSQ